MKLLAMLLGLILVLEGIPWFLSPKRVKNLLRQIMAIPNASLRFGGLAAMLSGLLTVYLARR